MTCAPTLQSLRVGQSATLGVPQVDAAQSRRLAELGLRAGEVVRLVQRAVGGARVVEVDGSRIALDGRTAARLPVEVCGAVDPAGSKAAR